MPDNDWSDEVRSIVDDLNEIDSILAEDASGSNFLCSFLTGVAGSGKSYQVKQRAKTGKLILTASTGIAAYNMGPGVTTIHSLLGFYDYDSLMEGFIVGRIQRKLYKLVEEEGINEVALDECFDSEQPILTEDGWAPIGRIVRDEEQVRVYSRNPRTGRLELKPILRWIAHPAPLNILKIDVGYSHSKRGAKSIRCTSEHKILTPSGYVEAGTLKVGDPVLVKGHRLTPWQFSLVVGGMLGDGGMSRGSSRSSPQMRFTQGEAQFDYLMFKHAMMGELAAPIVEGKSGYGPNKVYLFNVGVTEDIWKISKERTISERKGSKHSQWSPTDTFLSWIDERALAIWFMDDGTLVRQPLVDGTESYYANIDTSQFSGRDQFRFLKLLDKRFGLRGELHIYKTNRFRISFGKADTVRLLNIIGPHSPLAMINKVPTAEIDELPPERFEDTCESIVQSIEYVSPSTKAVYDIEVKDHHNYVAGNIIVSNCSMFGGPSLDLLYNAFDEVNKSPSVVKAGGLALTLVGDFCQLPAVKAPFAFEANCWPSFESNTTKLTKIWRQTDTQFLEALNHLRRGAGGPAAEILQSMGITFHKSIEPNYDGTTLMAHNEDVDRYNLVKLQSLPGKLFGLVANRWGCPEVINPKTGKGPSEWDRIPDRVALKIGARVMILSNDTEGWTYVNGSTGVVAGLAKGMDNSALVRIALDDGMEVEIGRITRRVERRKLPEGYDRKEIAANSVMAAEQKKPYYKESSKKYVLGEVTYYPLRLAWASTIHKSQGLSLSRVQIDMSKHFFGAAAMSYVSFSRCRTPEGLRLVGSPDLLVKRCNIDSKVLPWL
jgi:hypothetical protein